MKARLDDELSRISTSVSENAASIKENKKSLKSSVSGLSHSVKENVTSIKENTKSLNQLSIKGLHSAYKSRWDSASAKITFDKVMFSTGAGEMDAASGTFYCEQTGTYHVSWDLLNVLPTSKQNVICLHRNGKQIPESMHNSYYGGARQTNDQGGRTMFLSLNFGDTLWLQTAWFTGEAHSIWFNVHLIA